MRRDEQGMTLIEALVAMMVLTVVLAGLARLMVASTSTTAIAKHVTTAAVLAADKLEQLRAAPFSADAVADEDAPETGEYVRRWWIDPLPAHPDDAVVLRVSVARRGGLGAASEVRLVTVRARRAP